MLCDYHIHTQASFDCFTPARDMCQRAFEAGISAIALTDHMDFLPQHEINWQTDFERARDQAERAIVEFSGKLDIAWGVEFGQPQFNKPEADRFVQTYKPDFIIGSIHHLDPSFDIGTRSVAGRDPVALFHTYLDLLLELAQHYEYDVLGHLTFPWRYYKRELDYDFDTHEYRHQFEEIFDVVVQRGKGIEINTSGLRQKLDDYLPNETILRWYRARGGEVITTGSDAHTPAHVGLAVESATDLARRIGFPGVATYRQREATIHPF
jgi:histidinol-phosphatase (PHP family)